MINLYTPSKSENHRSKKASDLMRSLLAEIFIRGDLPPLIDSDTGEILTLPVSITITHVKMSANLQSATVYIMPFNGEKQEETLTYLRRAQGHLRHCLGPKLHFKSTPTLTFVIDPTFDQAKRIDALLDQLP